MASASETAPAVVPPSRPPATVTTTASTPATVPAAAAAVTPQQPPRVLDPVGVAAVTGPGPRRWKWGAIVRDNLRKATRRKQAVAGAEATAQAKAEEYLRVTTDPSSMAAMLDADTQRLWMTIRCVPRADLRHPHLWPFAGPRTVSLTPLPNVWNAVGCTARNAGFSLLYAGRAVGSNARLAAETRGSALRGLPRGFRVAASYAVIGLVISPLLHIPFGFINNAVGILNAATARFVFCAEEGRYRRCNVDAHAKEQATLAQEMALLWGVTATRTKETRFEQWRITVGRKVLGTKELTEGEGGAAVNFYTTLGLDLRASTEDVKKRYKILAHEFHPDRNPTPEAAVRFVEVTKAYKVLSIPKERKEYDERLGSIHHLASHQRMVAKFPGQNIVQMTFGGRAFLEHVTGPFFRSRWHMRHYASRYFSHGQLLTLHGIRTRVLSVELRRVLDSHALAAPAPPTATGGPPNPAAALNRAAGQRVQATPATATPAATTSTGSQARAPDDFDSAFKKRCEEYVAALGMCCFGRELLKEVGLEYTYSAQLFLGQISFARAQFHVMQRMTQGMTHIQTMLKTKADPAVLQTAAGVHAEWNEVVSDLHHSCRKTAMCVLYDASVPSKDVAVRRAHALKFLGDLMVRNGTDYYRDRPVTDLLAYMRRHVRADSNFESPPHFSGATMQAAAKGPRGGTTTHSAGGAGSVGSAASDAPATAASVWAPVVDLRVAAKMRDENGTRWTG